MEMQLGYPIFIFTSKAKYAHNGMLQMCAFTAPSTFLLGLPCSCSYLPLLLFIDSVSSLELQKYPTYFFLIVTKR